MSSHLEFWLPMPPRATNRSSNAHWSTEAKQKTLYLRELEQRLDIHYHVPAIPDKPINPARLHATFYFAHRGHFSDRDNRTARLKRVIDWLVKKKYIAGDRDEQLLYEIPDQQIRTGGEPDMCSLHLILETV
jgi:hypothetical protein